MTKLNSTPNMNDYTDEYFPINKCGKIKVRALTPRPAKHPSPVYIKKGKSSYPQIRLPREPMPRFGVYVDGKRVLTFSFWDNVDALRGDVPDVLSEEQGSASFMTFAKIQENIEAISIAVNQIVNEIFCLYQNTEEFSLLPETDVIKQVLKEEEDETDA